MRKLGPRYAVLLVEYWLLLLMPLGTISVVGGINFHKCPVMETGEETVATTTSVELCFPA